LNPEKTICSIFEAVFGCVPFDSSRKRKVVETKKMREWVVSGVAACSLLIQGSLHAQRSEDIYKTKETSSQSQIKPVQPELLEAPDGKEPKPPVSNPSGPSSQPIVPLSTPPIKSTSNGQASKPKPPTGPAEPSLAAKEAETDRPAFLGVHYEISRTLVSGSYVTEVEPNTPAALVGLRVGDVLTQADGRELHNLEDLVRVISAKKVGDKVSLTVHRAGKTFTVNPVLVARNKDLVSYQYGSSDGYVPMPDGKSILIVETLDPSKPFLGITFRREERIYSVEGEEIASVPRNQPIEITEVTPGSTAYNMGLQKGDVLSTLNGVDVTGFATIPELLDKMEIGDEVRVTYKRNGRPYTAVGLLAGNPALSKNPNKYKASEPTNPTKVPAVGNTASDVDFSNLKPAVVVETTVHPTEVGRLRRASGYDFPGDPNLSLQDFRVSPLATPGFYAVSFTVKTKGIMRIFVLDKAGGFVYSEELPSFSGSYNRTFTLPPQDRGDYFVEISHNGKSFTRKITLQ